MFVAVAVLPSFQPFLENIGSPEFLMVSLGSLIFPQKVIYTHHLGDLKGFQSCFIPDITVFSLVQDGKT